MATPSEDLARAYEAVGDLLAEVRPEQWKKPTPCTEWNVREVVAHLVGMDLVFAAMIEGGPMPERGVDRLGDDPVGAYRVLQCFAAGRFLPPRGARAELCRTLGECHGRRAPADPPVRSARSRMGPRPGHRNPCPAARRRCRAGPGVRRAQLSPQSRTGRFAEPQPVEETAPAIDRLAAFLGRHGPTAAVRPIAGSDGSLCRDHRRAGGHRANSDRSGSRYSRTAQPRWRSVVIQSGSRSSLVHRRSSFSSRGRAPRLSGSSRRRLARRSRWTR